MGGYVILDIMEVKEWSLVGGMATGKIDGIYKRLTNTEKPILIHNLNKLVLPPTINYSAIKTDFFANLVESDTDETHGEGIYIDFGQDIYVYEDDTILIG